MDIENTLQDIACDIWKAGRNCDRNLYDDATEAISTITGLIDIKLMSLECCGNCKMFLTDACVERECVNEVEEGYVEYPEATHHCKYWRKNKLSNEKENLLIKIEKENDVLKKIILDTFWMARRYADGRHTYAPSTIRDAYNKLKELGIHIKRDDVIKEPTDLEKNSFNFRSDWLYDTNEE